MAKNASMQSVDMFDIYAPRNPLNTERRKERQKHESDKTLNFFLMHFSSTCEVFQSSLFYPGAAILSLRGPPL